MWNGRRSNSTLLYDNESPSGLFLIDGIGKHRFDSCTVAKFFIMQIEIKKLSFNERLSEETNCFVADLHIEGKYVGYAKNSGHGGETEVRAKDQASWKIIEEAEVWCKALPAKTWEYEGKTFTMPITLDGYIDDLVTNALKEKDRKKFEKKMETHIMWGVPGGMRYTEVSLKKYGGVAALLGNVKGKAALATWLIGWKAKFKEGEQFLNTNLPKEVMP
jgi:hypothetical protein